MIGPGGGGKVMRPTLFPPWLTTRAKVPSGEMASKCGPLNPV